MGEVARDRSEKGKETYEKQGMREIRNAFLVQRVRMLDVCLFVCFV